MGSAGRVWQTFCFHRSACCLDPWRPTWPDNLYPETRSNTRLLTLKSIVTLARMSAECCVEQRKKKNNQLNYGETSRGCRLIVKKTSHKIARLVVDESRSNLATSIETVIKPDLNLCDTTDRFRGETVDLCLNVKRQDYNSYYKVVNFTGKLRTRVWLAKRNKFRETLEARMIRKKIWSNKFWFISYIV